MDGFKGWVVVAGSLVALAITSGVTFFIMAILIPPMMADTGWSLTQINIGITMWGIVGAVFSPVCGRLIDRYGARTIMTAGTITCFVAMMALGRVQSLPQLYFVLSLSAIGAMANTYMPVAAVVTLWFDRLRGVAIGVAMLGLGVGGAIMPQIANSLLKAYTWRDTFTGMAFILLLALGPILLLIRNPREGERRDSQDLDPSEVGATETKPLEKRLYDLAPWEAMRTRSFWGISLGDALTGLVYAIFTTNLVVYLSADIEAVAGSLAQPPEGVTSADEATNIYSLLLLCIAGGTFVFGGLANVLPIRGVMILCYCLPALAAALLLPPHLALLAYAFAVIGGLAGGGRQALFPVALAHSFGTTHVGGIYGLSNSFFLIGNALGPTIGAVLYETTGSTRTVYGFSVVLLAVSAVLVALMRDERRFRGEAE